MACCLKQATKEKNLSKSARFSFEAPISRSECEDQNKRFGEQSPDLSGRQTIIPIILPTSRRALKPS